MNPSPQAVAAIKTFVAGLAGGWAGNTDAQVVTAANNPTINNPIATALPFPKPFRPADLFNVLSTASQTNLKTFGGLGQLMVDAVAMNVSQCQLWTAFMATTGIITAAEKTAMLNIINATVADPSWQAQIGWAQANLGRLLDLDDSAVARAS